jgi:hypothetical protein
LHKSENGALDGGINTSPCYTIAAYDDKKLVAIGYLPTEANQPHLAPTMIHVLPAYGQRGLGITIQELLIAEWKLTLWLWHYEVSWIQISNIAVLILWK